MNNSKQCDICCIGHITKDKIVTPSNINYAAGGTAFYFSHAVNVFKDASYKLVTVIGESEQGEVHALRNAGIEVTAAVCKQSVFFENIYGENSDERKQCVLSKADPFTVEMLNGINARIVHLGPLLNDDFAIDTIEAIAPNHLLSLDVQGFLRTVQEDGAVIPVDWHEKEKVLKNIHFLKANEHELATLTGTKNITDGINKIFEWGVKEIIITLGHSGSILFDGKEYYKIPAYKPRTFADVTGCGDTYMAGYLYSRAKNKSIQDAGNFAAAMATLKIEHIGTFNGSPADIINCLNTFEKVFPEI